MFNVFNSPSKGRKLRMILSFLLKDNPSFKEIGVGAPSRRNVSMVWPDNPKNCVTKEQEPVKGGLESDLWWKLIFLLKSQTTKLRIFKLTQEHYNVEANRPRGTWVMNTKIGKQTEITTLDIYIYLYL